MIIEKKLGIKGDYQYKAYHSSNPLQKNWHKNKFDTLNLFFQSESNLNQKNILDLGTGSGNFELIFHKTFKKIVGADYNDEALNFLKAKLVEQKINNVDLFIADFTNLDEKKFKDKFDYIIMIDVIEHFKTSDAKNLLPKLHRLLKDNGKVIVVTPNYNSAWVILEKILDRINVLPKFEGEQHLAKYTPLTLSNLFRKNFTEINTTTFNTFSFLAVSYKINKTISKLEYKMKLKFGNLIFSVFLKD